MKVGKWESGKVRGVGSHRHTLTPSHFLTLVHAPHLCGENIENNSVQILSHVHLNLTIPARRPVLGPTRGRVGERSRWVKCRKSGARDYSNLSSSKKFFAFSAPLRWIFEKLSKREDGQFQIAQFDR